MPTVKQIIDSLNCFSGKLSCKNCVYQSTYLCHSNAVKDATETLQKLVPKKPKKINFMITETTFDCPNCEEMNIICTLQYPNFCQWCGQAIDWRQDDDSGNRDCMGAVRRSGEQ